MAAVELPALYVDVVGLVAASSRPVLINRDPGPDETAVPIDTTVALEIVDPGPAGIDRAETRVWINGILAFDGSATAEIQPEFDGPEASVSQTADTLRVVLHPTSPFESESTVSVRVESRTADGLDTIDETYTFQIEDRTAPRVVAAQAIEAKKVRVEFDEAVQVPAGATFLFSAQQFPAVPLATTDMVVDGNLVTISVHTEMTANVTYHVRAVGITDVHGNVVIPPFDGATFSGFQPPRPPGRRFDLWEMLPKHNRRDDQTGDLRRFIACLQDVTDVLLADIDQWPNILDLERAPEPFLDAILQDLGNPFPFELDTIGRRRLASVLVEMYRQKGTAKGIINAIRFFLGIDVQIISAYNAETAALGEADLGIDFVLGASTSFARYAFDVTVGRVLTETERRQIRAIVNYLKPAHTHFVNLVEPVPPTVPEHWEIGISELGETTDLH